ncbi:MAG: hypothetical protein P4L64_00010 [Caulobacteraceae bacterium]|nr:hypothetical protein [Caulobacteraceae bacterium]
MKTLGKAAVVAALTVGASAAAAPLKAEPPPIAVYWVSASTTSGFMAGMMGQGGRPSMGSMVGMMMRGGPDPNAAQHNLRLQLGSQRAPKGEPQAEHDAPAALNAGPVFPLVTPRAAPPEEEAPQPPEQYRKPQGRMLIYWGCGEHAGPGQPVVIDFAKMADAPQRYAGLMRGLPIAQMRPPSPGRSTTYGEWPNDRSRITIPANSSLVGSHVVQGNYSPEIRFTLSPQQDFMAPLRLTSNQPTPTGSVRLAWQPVPSTTGYFASVMGAQGRRGGDDATMVMWTSSAVQAAAFMAPDYIAPAEARRLVAEHVLLSPETTTCLVPQEVAHAAAQGMLSMTAYGEEANFGFPARPAPPIWVAKVRYRSATSALLGQADPMQGDNRQRGRRRDEPDGEGSGGTGRSILHGLGGLIP